MQRVLRWLACGLTWLVAAYLSYAVAGGYVGIFPTPLNLLAGLSILGAAAVATVSLTRRRA